MKESSFEKTLKEFGSMPKFNEISTKKFNELLKKYNSKTQTVNTNQPTLKVFNCNGKHPTLRLGMWIKHSGWLVRVWDEKVYVERRKQGKTYLFQNISRQSDIVYIVAQMAKKHESLNRRRDVFYFDGRGGLTNQPIIEKGKGVKKSRFSFR